MTQRESKVFHNCKIMEKGVGEHNGKEAWKVTLNKEVFGGKYDLICTRVEPEIANRLQPGQQYSLVLERENKKKPEYDGERDWMFYWGLVGIADGDAAQQTETAANGAAPRQRTVTPSGWEPSASDQYRADGQEKGNSVTNGTTLVMGHFEKKGTLPTPEWLNEAAELVNFASVAIRSGRGGDQEEQAADDAPPEPPEPPESEAAYIESVLDEQETTGEMRIFEV